ncbi:unnamed protein product [Prorocentrum cordatum]|uniref:Poly [ADP-ribose] polymerase n=1 Tax=Prorocentrum cordatum TaxID=2364126 RepID=A0ABN9UQ68_9DINO|nr:unnamed protein product [Polarella glacialis]
MPSRQWVSMGAGLAAAVAPGSSGEPPDSALGPDGATGEAAELQGKSAASTEADPAELERALGVAELLLSAEPPAPPDMPQRGQIVDFDHLLRFVRQHRRMCDLRGFDAARPRVVYHWTSEANFESIVASGLRVPDGGSVAVAHGSSFGNGIYVSPDFRYGEEFFGYGARAAFMCLGLPGRQHFGKPDVDGLGQPDGYDSAVGREGQRGVDEWVFFRADQLLPVFLVDKLGVVIARDAAAAAIRELHRPWPPAHQAPEEACVAAAAPDASAALPEGSSAGAVHVAATIARAARTLAAHGGDAAQRWPRRPQRCAVPARPRTPR